MNPSSSSLILKQISDSSCLLNRYNKLICQHKIACKTCEASKFLNSDDIQQKLEIHRQIQKSGKYNFQHCRIRINFKINVDFMRTMLINYKDIQVCEFLEFGFPIGFKDCTENLTSKDQIGNIKITKGQQSFPMISMLILKKKVNMEQFWVPSKLIHFKKN